MDIRRIPKQQMKIAVLLIRAHCIYGTAIHGIIGQLVIPKESTHFMRIVNKRIYPRALVEIGKCMMAVHSKLNQIFMLSLAYVLRYFHCIHAHEYINYIGFIPQNSGIVLR